MGQKASHMTPPNTADRRRQPSAKVGGANRPRGAAGIGVVKTCRRAGLVIQYAADMSGCNGGCSAARLTTTQAARLLAGAPPPVLHSAVAWPNRHRKQETHGSPPRH
jgi:hypothetical protein